MSEREKTLREEAEELAMEYCGGCKGSDVGCDEQGSCEAYQDEVEGIVRDLEAEE